MKIETMLTDVCTPEDWILEHPAYVAVPVRFGMTHQQLTEAIANAEIKGKDLLALAANQQEMPGVLPIWEAEYLGLPYSVFQGFALLDTDADEAWLGLAEKIRKAMKGVEVENLYLSEEDDGLKAYYLLEFDICES